MSAPVDVLATMDAAAQWRGEFLGDFTSAAELKAARDAVAELIEADEKYDEARRQVYDLSRTGAVQCRADLDLLDKAAARRAAALARVQVVQS